MYSQNQIAKQSQPKMDFKPNIEQSDQANVASDDFIKSYGGEL